MSNNTSTRIDHFAWVVHPENLDRYVEQITEIFGVTFLRHPGTGSLGPETRIMIDFEAGLELVAPKGRSTPLAEQFTGALDEKGEIPLACVIRVPDVQEATARIKRAGHEVGPNLLGDDAEARRAGLAAWADTVVDMLEYPVDAQLPETALFITKLDFDPEPSAYEDRVGRLDRVAWIVEEKNARRYVELLEALFDTRFEPDSRAESDVASFVS